MPGHPGELVVEPEVVLQGDGGQGLVLLLDGHPLLGLDRLVEALGVAATLEHPSGELVDDLHLAVVEEVVHVALIELLRPQRHIEMVDQIDRGVVVHVLHAEHLLDPLHALLGGDHLALRLVDLVVLVPPQGVGDPRELLVPARGVGHPAADDERCPRLVHQDRVHLVDDGEGVAPLHHVLGPHRHVVPQVVEPELVVGPVGDVGGVRRTAALRGSDPPGSAPR